MSTVLWVAGAVPAMLALLIGNSAMSIVGLMLLGVGGVVCLIGAVRA